MVKRDAVPEAEGVILDGSFPNKFRFCELLPKDLTSSWVTDFENSRSDPEVLN